MRLPKYEDYEGLIHKLVWNFVQKGMPQEEALSTCNAAFVRARASYDRSRGQFTTLLQHACYNALLTDSQRFARFPEGMAAEAMELQLVAAGPDPAAHCAWKDALSNISAEAMAVVSIVLEAPEEMLEHLRGNTAPCGQRMKSALQRLLKQKYHWTDRRIQASFAEIAQALV